MAARQLLNMLLAVPDFEVDNERYEWARDLAKTAIEQAQKAKAAAAVSAAGAGPIQRTSVKYVNPS